MLVADFAYVLSESSELLRLVPGGLRRDDLRFRVRAVVFGILAAVVGLRCGVVQLRPRLRGNAFVCHAMFSSTFPCSVAKRSHERCP